MKKILLLVALIALTVVSCGKKEKKADVEATTPAVEETAPVVDANATPEKIAFDAVVAKLDPANKCTVCHQVDVKTIGPAYKEVAKVYKEKGGNIVKFLKQEADPIVDPALFDQMLPNLQVTKELPGEDLAALAAYIRSLEE